MADQMMDPAAGAADSTAATGAQDDAPDTSGGYCIEVRVDADGKIKVGVEPLGAAEAEDAQGGEPAEGDDNEQYQEVGSIGEALKLVKQIYAGAGEMQDMGAGMDEMSAGYGVKKSA